MKSRTISLDEATVRLLDKLAASSSHVRSRSALVRAAIREFAKKETHRQGEVKERQILRKHRARLARQARALVEEQARL